MKKTAAIILALALCLCLGACGGGAAAPTDIPYETPGLDSSPTDIEQPAATPTPLPQPVGQLCVCGVYLVKNGQPTGVGYEGVSYENGVLTLEGAEIIADTGSVAPIFFSGELEIVLKGENSVTAANGVSAIVGGGEEPDDSASLTLSGDGSLSVNAEGESACALAVTGGVTVESTGTLELTGGMSAISAEGGEMTYAQGVGVVEETGTHVIIGALA